MWRSNENCVKSIVSRSLHEKKMYFGTFYPRIKMSGGGGGGEFRPLHTDTSCIACFCVWENRVASNGFLFCMSPLE